MSTVVAKSPQSRALGGSQLVRAGTSGLVQSHLISHRDCVTEELCSSKSLLPPVQTEGKTCSFSGIPEDKMQMLLTESLLPVDKVKAATVPYERTLPTPTVCLSLSFQKTGVLSTHCHIIPARSRVMMPLLAQSNTKVQLG